MKKEIVFIILLFSGILFSQNKVEPKTTESRIFKGTIQGQPITLFLKNVEIIDCSLYGNHIEGWYYYDKYKIKIPLNGYSGYPHFWDMKLYYFGKNHQKKAKDVLKKRTVYAADIDSIYRYSNYDEILTFKRIWSGKKITSWKGAFKNHQKTAEIIIDSDDLLITKFYDYFTLPNGKRIDLLKIFKSYQGHKFYAMTKERNENRIIFYYDTISKADACGYCGADKNLGYHILYFDKNWKIKKWEEYPINDCFTMTYAQTIAKNKNGAKYFIKGSKNLEGKEQPPYYLIVDKKQSTIKKHLKNTNF